MVKPCVTPLSGPFPVLLRLSWNAEGMTTETTVASILKSFLQGQGPHLRIQAHGQQACGLPKVTHSVNNGAQRRIPTAAISPPHPTAGMQDSKWTHVSARARSAAREAGKSCPVG